MRKVLLLFCGLILLMSSCTVHKRHFNQGYYIDWNKAEKKAGQGTSVESKKISPIDSPESKNNTETSITNGSEQIQPTIPTIGNSKSPKLNSAPGYNQFTKEDRKPGIVKKQALHKKEKSSGAMPPDRWDLLFLGLALFFGGLILGILILATYSSSGVALGAVGIVLLIAAVIAMLVGYVFLEQAFPGLGCLLLIILQVFLQILS